MTRSLEIAAATLALVTALISGTIVVESRYAKAVDVQQELNSLYSRTLKIRILELQLKPPPLSPADRALLDHLQQELREATSN